MSNSNVKNVDGDVTLGCQGMRFCGWTINIFMIVIHNAATSDGLCNKDVMRAYNPALAQYLDWMLVRPSNSDRKSGYKHDNARCTTRFEAMAGKLKHFGQDSGSISEI